MIQLQVLNKALQMRDPSLITLNNLSVGYFSDYPKEFSWIKEHLSEYGQMPDMESFLDKFPNFEVVEVKETDTYLIGELVKDKNTREMALTFNKVRELLMAGDTDKAMQAYKASAERLSEGVALQCVDILRDRSRYDAYVSRTEDFDKFYIKTGFKELDQIIGGWDREEELATIVARTNMGKSWFLQKFSLSAAEQGLRVGMYSGEMSERKVGYRIDTMISHISNGALMHGNGCVKAEYKKYMDELPQKLPGTLKILTPKMIDGPAGVNALAAFVEKEKLDILFVDQLSLLEDDRRARNPIEKAADISKDLKNLQVMKRIPIVSVCQQNRTKNEDNSVDTTQISMSDRIGQDSTIVIFIEKKDDTMKLTLVKSRDSENGKSLTYKVDLNKGFFVYVPDEKDGLGGQGSEGYAERYSVGGGGKGDVF